MQSRLCYNIYVNFCFERSPVLLKALASKLQEALISVLPVACIVFLLYLSPFTTLSDQELTVFFLTTALLIVGIGLFNLGADLAMTPMGEQVGVGLTKSRKTLLLLAVSLLLGVLITVSEPDLTVLGEQLKELINKTLLIWTVGIGVGLFLTLSVIKIIFKKSLSSLLMYFYMILFAVASLLIMNGSGDFLAVAFDSGGVTTGPVTVPFMMALGVGIASVVGGKNASENSFGMVAMCSVGPILAVLLLGLLSSGEVTYAIPYQSVSEILPTFAITVIHVMKEVAIALGMIVAAFFVLQITVLHLSKKKLKQIAVGILYTYFGLVMFLSAVNIGYMPIGYRLGSELANQASPFIVGFGFLLGHVLLLAEKLRHGLLLLLLRLPVPAEVTVQHRADGEVRQQKADAQNHQPALHPCAHGCTSGAGLAEGSGVGVGVGLGVGVGTAAYTCSLTCAPTVPTISSVSGYRAVKMAVA